MNLHGILRCGIIILSLYLSSFAYAHEVVQLQTIEEFDKHGKPVPLNKVSRDLLNYIEKSLNLRFEVKRVPWKRALDNALHNDIVLMGMSHTSERAKRYAFSEPINANGNWLITRCDATFKFNGINDLRGKLIGVVLGTSAGEEFDQQMHVLFKVENDIGAGISRLKKLMAKRMDAIVWYGVTGNHREMQETLNKNYAALSESFGYVERPAFCVLPKPIAIVNNHFAMRISPRNQNLLNRINQAIAKGRKEGAIPPMQATNLD
ncbi:transporter substrate-binding domain-containing protein [Undibacterium amnicola]|uniref:Transporter substrate-binding domain-containing protein n=1 Tax=Undibacterium amnicola TaxID=1834038 RepID=A0ABR6XUG7_9BURK|nr:transporter substrate-binding domain-containing protein [Undibacterium amnicola]MBC3833120.1 transporter substrate-binding domain-containing protein [Undibacterium amnicola]